VEHALATNVRSVTSNATAMRVEAAMGASRYHSRQAECRTRLARTLGHNAESVRWSRAVSIYFCVRFNSFPGVALHLRYFKPETVTR